MSFRSNFVAVLAIAIFVSCNVEDGDPGFNSLFNSSKESMGVNCIAGGIKLETGLDLDRNNVLNSSEVTKVEYICNGSDASSDKLTRIEIPVAGSNSSSTDWLVSGDLVKFNKLDYFSDSIVLVGDPYVANPSNEVTIELINDTDGNVIEGSRIASNSTFENREMKISQNFIDNLPEKEITIRVRMKSGTEGSFAASSYSGLFLFIYKK